MCNLLGLLTWGDQSLGRITCGAMSLRGELYLGRRIPSDKSDVGRRVHKHKPLLLTMTYNLKTLLHQSGNIGSSHIALQNQYTCTTSYVDHIIRFIAILVFVALYLLIS